MSKTICISYTIDTYPYKAQPLRHVPPGVAGASDSSVLFGLHGVRTTEVALKPVVCCCSRLCIFRPYGWGHKRHKLYLVRPDKDLAEVKYLQLRYQTWPRERVVRSGIEIWFARHALLWNVLETAHYLLYRGSNLVRPSSMTSLQLQLQSKLCFTWQGWVCKLNHFWNTFLFGGHTRAQLPYPDIHGGPYNYTRAIMHAHYVNKQTIKQILYMYIYIFIHTHTWPGHRSMISLAKCTSL